MEIDKCIRNYFNLGRREMRLSLENDQLRYLHSAGNL